VRQRPAGMRVARGRGDHGGLRVRDVGLSTFELLGLVEIGTEEGPQEQWVDGGHHCPAAAVSRGESLCELDVLAAAGRRDHVRDTEALFAKSLLDELRLLGDAYHGSG